MHSIYKLYNGHREKALMFADQALVSGSNFASSIFYARLLGLETYGGFVLSWMLVLFASSFQQSYIFSPMLNLFSSRTSYEDKKEYLSGLFMLQLVFAVVALAVSLLFVFINSKTVYINVGKINPYLLPLCIFAFLMHDFQRKKSMMVGKVINALFLDVLFTTLLFLCVFFTNAYGIFSLEILWWIIFSCYLSTAIIGSIGERWFMVDMRLIRKTAISHWENGKWLLAPALLQWLSGNYFIIVAGNVLGNSQASIIRIAQNIVGVLNILYISIESYVPVSAAKIYRASGTNKLFKYLGNVSMLGLLIVVPLCVGMAIFSKELLLLVYGSTYLEYSFVVKLFALFYVLVFISIPLRTAVKTLDHNHDIFIGYIISAVFSLVSGYYIVTTFGIYGVVFGIVFSQLLTQAWYIFSLKRNIYEYYSFSTGKSKS